MDVYLERYIHLVMCVKRGPYSGATCYQVPLWAWSTFFHYPIEWYRFKSPDWWRDILEWGQCISHYGMWLEPLLRFSILTTIIFMFSSCFDVSVNLEYLCLDQGRCILVTDENNVAVIVGAALISTQIMPWGIDVLFLIMRPIIETKVFPVICLVKIHFLSFYPVEKSQWGKCIE